MDPEISIEDRLEAVLKGQAGSEEETPNEQDQQNEQLPDDSSEESTTVEAQASQAEQTQDDGEEVEYEGARYKVPKELKDALLRQSDYTRKTQDIAKQRQSYEELTQTLEQQRQFHEAAFDAAAEAKALALQIGRFDGLDWSTLADSDPAEFLKLDRAYRALKDQHATKAQEAHQKFAQAQQESAKQQQLRAVKAHEELSRDIQGWGPELQTKLAESGKSFGFTEQELRTLIDPRMVKVLHMAHQWKQLQSAKPDLTKRVAIAKPVTALAARSAQTTQDATRFAETRKALQKHGRAADAEKLLEMRFARKVK